LVRSDYIPPELQNRAQHWTAAARDPASVHAVKGIVRCPPLPFTTIESDPEMASVPKVMAQFLVVGRGGCV